MVEWKKWIKHWVGWALYRSGLYRLLLRNRGTIVLFHRVDRRYPDNPITCTPEQFEAYCRFFARYFEVIPLSEMVARIEAGGDVGNTLCITFDDGFRDNHTTAAPMLKRADLPCTFFVTTGLIGTSDVPFWDEYYGIQSEWMTWEQVRELKDMGFSLGAHTVHHVDLGDTHGEAARREIDESRRTLETEVDSPVPWFSYPFGREDQITPENLDIVRDLGFRSCLSGFGGSVTADSELFPLPRLAVSPWYRSPFHFGWEMVFGNR